MGDPIATPDDLATYLDLGDLSLGRALLLLELAQNLCESVVDPLPATANAVVLAVAGRAYGNPLNVQSQAAGPFNTSYGAGASGGLYLSRQDKATLRRLAGSGGAFTIDPTPSDAGTALAPWDENFTFLNGVPLAEDTQ